MCSLLSVLMIPVALFLVLASLCLALLSIGLIRALMEPLDQSPIQFPTDDKL